jgi:hypothetical protein
MKLRPIASLILSIAIVFSLAACGSGDKTPVPAAPVKEAPKRAAQPADPTEKMAHAVVAGKSGASVDLKYDVLNKPEPGKAIEIELALIAGAVLDSASLNVSAMPGITIVSNPDASFGKLGVGEIARQKFIVMADQPSVVYLTVTATATSVGINSSRTFAIPLIVATPVEAPATPVAENKTPTAPEKK